MATKTTFEHSEFLRSPSGTYRVSVSSTRFGADRGQSQVVVEGPSGGSGLVAFQLPRVPFGFDWNGDDELIIKYPDDLPPPRIDATKSSYGWGGRGRVVYQAVPRDRLRPLVWTEAGEIEALTEESLERGVLVALKIDGQLEYSYSYYDAQEADSSSEMLIARGFQGGGETWAGIIFGLVALRAAEIAHKIDLDPEADGLAVRSSDRAALITVANLVAVAKRDPELLAAAIELAASEDQIE